MPSYAYCEVDNQGYPTRNSGSKQRNDELFVMTGHAMLNQDLSCGSLCTYLTGRVKSDKALQTMPGAGSVLEFSKP